MKLPISLAACALSAAIPIAGLAAEKDTSSIMDEIIVTTKRGTTENVQTMSEAVTAFSGPSLEREFAVTLEDFNHAIPNVQLEHVGLFQAAASFTMRGIGTSGIESFADPAVAVFVDDVYYSRNATALLDLFDIESISAFRGPQGALYGRNAFAGAIAVRTKRPVMDETSLQLELDTGNAGRQNIGAVANFPLGSKAAFRVAANYHELDGFFKNDGVVLDSYDPATATLVTHIDEKKKGDRENGERSILVRPSLHVEPSENWRIDVIGEVWKDKGDGTANWSQCYQPGSLPPPLGNGPSGNPAVHQLFGFPCKQPYGDSRFGIPGDGSDPFEIGFNLHPNQTIMDIWGITVDTSYDTDVGTFSLLLNHRNVDEDITTDTDGYNWDVFSSSRLQTFESSQVELRYATTLNDNIDLLAGFFYMEDEYEVQQYLWIFLDSALFGGGGFTRNNPQVSYGANSQKRYSWAPYAQIDWHFNDQWTLVVGARYTYEKKHDVLGMAINDSVCPAGQTPATAACNGAPFAGTNPGNAKDFDPSVRFGPVSEDWNAFSPKVGVEYQLNDTTMFFANWQRAFKSGGFVNNAGTLPVFSSPYDQEQVDNYEFGVRSDLFDDHLRLNANIFWAEYKDLQRGVIRAAPTSTGQETFTDNAAGAESFGIEVAFDWAIIQGLNVGGNIGYLDIEYKDFIADLTGSGTATDNSDLELVRAPKWDMSFYARYEWDLADLGTLTAMARYSYTDEMELTTPNDVGFHRDELATVDANLTWESSDAKYRFALWGKNLTNNTELLGGTPVATLFAFATPTQPRQYGATLSVRLGN
ncbi:MAG: TonB-dependent receptor [Pseudomonadales bacterium]|nr:TonB-dependent receptor [Pseudomonadales bacterium]MCP5183150.1 TonB-dependent receptor [Pseudomonadales bacterium]